MQSHQTKFNILVNSEIGELEGVLLHTPGVEVENMTPNNAERALYSDILNLSIVSREYSQLSGILEKVTKVFQIKSLLKEVLSNTKVKQSLITKVCEDEGGCVIKEQLLQMSEQELADALVEGVLMKKDNLSRFLSHERYSLQPLHNFFFTRDSSVTINDWVLISRMANSVRARESLIMEAVLDFHPLFSAKTLNSSLIKSDNPKIKIEGGDVLIAREDVLLVGIGVRTNPQAVDFLIEHYKKLKKRQYIIVQELPRQPESFIHLDMVFTFLDVDTCMAYEPVILEQNRYRAVVITIDNGNVEKIAEESDLLRALATVGIPLQHIPCGGHTDIWQQQREQWHSGANFFAIAPGKLIGYRRNHNTIEALAKNNFEIIDAIDVIEGKKDLADYAKYVVTIDGSELSRGGGGCRCMTMPLRRKPIEI